MAAPQVLVCLQTNIFVAQIGNLAFVALIGHCCNGNCNLVNWQSTQQASKWCKRNNYLGEVCFIFLNWNSLKYAPDALPRNTSCFASYICDAFVLFVKGNEHFVDTKSVKSRENFDNRMGRAERYLGTIYRNILKTYGAVVVVAQLVERSLPTPVVRGSNPHIGGKNLYWTITVNCFEKTTIKKIEAGIGPFKKGICWGVGLCLVPEVTIYCPTKSFFPFQSIAFSVF